MNPSLAHDLALKRATQSSPDSRPNFAWRECVPTDAPLLPEILLLAPQGETRFDLAEIADTLGKAVTNVHLARGEKGAIFTPETRAFVARIIREVAANLAALSLRQSPLRISLNDLYELIEKTLIDNSAYDVAKSLLLNRSNKLVPAGPHATAGVRVIRRNNHVVPYIDQKVEIAVRKAFLSLQRDSAPRSRSRGRSPAGARLAPVLRAHRGDPGHCAGGVDEGRPLQGRRGLHPLPRPAQRAAPDAGRGRHGPCRRRRDCARAAAVDDHGQADQWGEHPLGPERPAEAHRVRLHRPRALPLLEQIEAELLRSVFDQISQKDLDATIILNSKTLIERDADFAKFAGRIQLTYIYEEVLGWDIVRDGIGKLKEFHRHALRQVPRAWHRHQAAESAAARLRSRPAGGRPRSVRGSGVRLPRHPDAVRSLPDHRQDGQARRGGSRRRSCSGCGWRWACSSTKPGPRGQGAFALRLYKSRRFCSSTPTLFNSGTLHSQLSSCYLYYVDDSLEGIMYRGIAENAQLSKWAGGLGGSWTAVRGTGAHIAGTNGESQGVIPFLKLHNDQLVAVNQGGKRKGSGCAYLESWHNDIFEFLELRKNTGDDRRRTHDMNTANWIPDLFMKRMEARQHWTLFRSNEVKDLHELYGRAFEERYLRTRSSRRRARSERAADRGARAVEEDALDALRDRPPVDHLQGRLQHALAAGSRRRDPLLEPLHRDHAQHLQRRDRGLQPRLGHPRDAPQAGRLDRPRQAARDDPHRRPRARQRHRHQLLPDEGREDAPTCGTGPIGLGVMGLANALYLKGIAFASTGRRVQ
jgi:ribonucleoside-diphosphate reductase alpha chain